MQEATVTVDGVTREIGFPFFSLATENPWKWKEHSLYPGRSWTGFMCLQLGYPEREGEKTIIRRFINNDPLQEVEPVATVEDLVKLRNLAAKVRFAEPVLDYLLSITRETRETEGVRLGVSPRGTLFCPCRTGAGPFKAGTMLFLMIYRMWPYRCWPIVCCWKPHFPCRMSLAAKSLKDSGTSGCSLG